MVHTQGGRPRLGYVRASMPAKGEAPLYYAGLLGINIMRHFKELGLARRAVERHLEVFGIDIEIIGVGHGD